jgi:hypothetical protein
VVIKLLKNSSIRLALIFANVQSFVPIVIIKGMLFTNIFILFQLISDFFFKPKRFKLIVYYLFWLILLFSIWQMAVQLNYLITGIVSAELYSDLIFISQDDSMLLKPSMFTQSLYLLFCFIFFLYIFLLCKGKESDVIYISKLALIAYLVYGFFEWTSYLFMGLNLDFLSNRITGEGYEYGLFQIISLGGTDLMRFKSLSGEPSMLAYTLVPFLILFYYLKDRFWIFLLIALVLSTSTTFLLGLLIFILIDLLFLQRALVFLIFSSLLMVSLMVIFHEMIFSFYEFTIAKLKLEHDSGFHRFDYFYNHFYAWFDSDFLNQVLGHGFGYVRSTDYLSTVLFNSGLLGFFLITFLFFYPAIKLLKSKEKLIYGTGSALISIYFMMMLSVSEFYYFHVWFFLGIGWYFALNKESYVSC